MFIICSLVEDEVLIRSPCLMCAGSIFLEAAIINIVYSAHCFGCQNIYSDVGLKRFLLGGIVSSKVTDMENCLNADYELFLGAFLL